MAELKNVPASPKPERIQLGNYILGETIGNGSFGKVKLAEHSITGHKVAMKIMSKRKMSNLELGVRVKREIHYLKVLRHPHIIKLYEVLTTPTELVMVMEYAPGELFKYIVDSKKLPEPEARRFFQQIISALEYCHRHKIVHRDLKPENLLLDQHNNLKIADFGLSNIMTDGDFLKTSCGSPNYAAPEVISGKLYSGPEVDVWSSGVILFVMLTGKLPFDDEYIPSLFRKINEGIYTVPGYVSREASELISAMLVVDPIKRITIPEIRQSLWFRVDLPDYLLPLPQLDENIFSNIDESIVDKLHSKLRLSKDMIEAALSAEADKVTGEHQSIRVAYQLIYDQLHIAGYPRDSILSSTSIIARSISAISPPPWDERTFDEDFDLQDSLSVGSLPKSYVSRSSPMVRRVTTSDEKIPPKQQLTSQFVKVLTLHEAAEKAPDPALPKWHLGIRSKSSAREILLELYQTMRKLNIQWKLPILPPNHSREQLDTDLRIYKVPCRYADPKGAGTVYFEWMLYKVPDVKKGGFLVDFKMCDYESDKGIGSLMFLEVCAKILIELAING